MHGWFRSTLLDGRVVKADVDDNARHSYGRFVDAEQLEHLSHTPLCEWQVEQRTCEGAYLGSVPRLAIEGLGDDFVANLGWPHEAVQDLKEVCSLSSPDCSIGQALGRRLHLSRKKLRGGSQDS